MVVKVAEEGRCRTVGHKEYPIGDSYPERALSAFKFRWVVVPPHAPMQALE